MNAPEEIVGRVIDELRDHPKVLTRCALTSRLWLYYARKALYHTVTLDNEQRANHVCSLVYAEPAIADCFRALKFNVYAHYMSERQCPPPDLQSWVTSTLALLALRLPNVSAIHFEYIRWQTLRGFDEDFLKALSNFASVSTIRFWACNFVAFAEFEGILLAFPGLRRLRLDSITCEQPLAKQTYTLQLDSLSIASHFSLRVLRDWLLKIKAPTTLRELAFEHLYDESDLHAAGEILANMGTALQSLTVCCRFSCDGYYRLQDVGQWLPLEYNTGLRTLHIRIYDLIQDYMHWIPNLLRLIDAPSLTTLIFDVCLYMSSQMFGEIWDDIAWLISESPRYASLQRVRFVHRGPLVVDAISVAVCQQFPLLHLRGILEVEDQRNPDLYK